MVVFRAMGLAMVVYTEYAQYLDVLLWLMIVGAMKCFTFALGGALATAAQFRGQVTLFVVVTVILICSPVLVPRTGLRGAALDLKALKFSRRTACLSVDARICSVSTPEMECGYGEADVSIPPVTPGCFERRF